MHNIRTIYSEINEKKKQSIQTLHIRIFACEPMATITISHNTFLITHNSSDSHGIQSANSIPLCFSRQWNSLSISRQFFDKLFSRTNNRVNFAWDFCHIIWIVLQFNDYYHFFFVQLNFFVSFIAMQCMNDNWTVCVYRPWQCHQPKQNFCMKTLVHSHLYTQESMYSINGRIYDKQGVTQTHTQKQWFNAC